MKRARDQDPLALAMRPDPNETPEERAQREGEHLEYPLFIALYCSVVATDSLLTVFMTSDILVHTSSPPFNSAAQEREAKQVSDYIDAEIESERKRVKYENNVKVLLLGM